MKEDLKNKWEESGILDGLKGNVKENITQLFECCKKIQITKIDEQDKKNIEEGKVILDSMNTEEFVNQMITARRLHKKAQSAFETKALPDMDTFNQLIEDLRNGL